MFLAPLFQTSGVITFPSFFWPTKERILLILYRCKEMKQHRAVFLQVHVHFSIPALNGGKSPKNSLLVIRQVGNFTNDAGL